MFTTRAYEKEALRLVLKEANQVAQALELQEQLPISEVSLVAKYIPPPRLAQRIGGVGNVTTSNYTYYVSAGNRFSFLEHSHLQQERIEFQKKFLSDSARIDTNAAYQLASEFLGKLLMDVEALNRDCSVRVQTVFPTSKSTQSLIPIYLVVWNKARQSGSCAIVEVCLPTKTLLQLRVEDPKYILRPPIVFTNLAELLSTNAPALTNAPIPPQ